MEDVSGVDLESAWIGALLSLEFYGYDVPEDARRELVQVRSHTSNLSMKDLTPECRGKLSTPWVIQAMLLPTAAEAVPKLDVTRYEGLIWFRCDYESLRGEGEEIPFLLLVRSLSVSSNPRC